jgi:site-specific recombinase XerD
MQSASQLDRAGRRRSPATTSSFHLGLPPERGQSLSARPTDRGGDHRRDGRRRRRPEGRRLRGMIVMLWRAGLRISEALALNETDLDSNRGAVLIRHGKGDKRREVGIDRWAWAHLEPWLDLRATLPAGALFCVLRGPTRGQPCAAAGIRSQLHHAAQAAGVSRRFAPHQLRHAHAVEMSREGISLIVIQRQLGHADLAITSRYLRGNDNTEIIQAVHERPEPMVPASRRLAPQR